MKKVSKHIGYHEVACRHCGKHPPQGMDPKVLELFEAIREAAGGSPIHINSGYRCPVHNKNVGGAKNSQHMRGTALDLTPRHISVKALHRIADRLNAKGGVGLYRTFVHVDTRGRKSRW